MRLARLWRLTAVRRLVVLASLAALWQAAALVQNNSLLFPTLHRHGAGLRGGGHLRRRAGLGGASLLILLKGHALAVALALVSGAVAVPVLREMLQT